MKRMACIAVAAVVSLALAGCGGSAAPTADKPADPSAAQSQQAPGAQTQEEGSQAGETSGGGKAGEANADGKSGEANADGKSGEANADGKSGESGGATETSERTPSTTSVSTGKKWQYAYPGDESPYLGAVCAYLGEVDAEMFDISDGMIPAVEVVRVDDSDENDIKVFGVYEVRNYELENKVLHLQSGSTFVGAIHIARDGSGYKPLKGEFAEDGARYDASLEEICEGYKGLYDDLSETIVPDKVRKLYMKECIEAFDLDVEKYQDIGEAPMPIEEWLSYSFD